MLPSSGSIDADMSHPPSLLPKMLAAMNDAGADLVVGSRYIPGGGTRNWEKEPPPHVEDCVVDGAAA